MPPDVTPLGSSVRSEALELFLNEALELCQQFEEKLLMWAEPIDSNQIHKLDQLIQFLAQGSHNLKLTDVQSLLHGLSTLLAVTQQESTSSSPPSSPPSSSAAIPTLLQQISETLHLTLLAHLSLIRTGFLPAQPLEFGLHSLLPQGLDVFAALLTAPLPDPTRRQVLLEYTHWLQYWSDTLAGSEFLTLTQTIHTALQKIGPSEIEPLGQVALAGLRVAYHGALRQFPSETSAWEPVAESSQNLADDWLPPAPSMSGASESGASESGALDLDLDTSQQLVWLAHQTIFCVASAQIYEIVLPQPDAIIQEHGQSILRWNNRRLPLYRMATFLDPIQDEHAIDPRSAQADDFRTDPSLILVIQQEPQPLAIALEVDHLLTDQTLKLEQWDTPPTQQTVAPPDCRQGWTRLEDGRLVEVVDVVRLIQIAAVRTPDTPSPILDQPLLSHLDSSTDLPRSSPPLVPTLLVVDDSRTVREVLSLTLEGEGYHVLQASDGQAAIAHLETHPEVNLVICDLEMANLNGFEFLRHRLQHPVWVNIPVLILSSHTSSDYRQLAQKLGAIAYLSIPYNNTELLTTIHTLLEST